MIPTLHNMASIELQRESGEKAMQYWMQALELAMKTGNAAGIYNVAGTVGSLMVRMDAPHQAKEMLSLAVNVVKHGGMKDTQNFAGMLAELESGDGE